MKQLSLNILDIVQNSIRAKADEISVEINESAQTDIYRIIIKDNGSGIPAEILEKLQILLLQQGQKGGWDSDFLC